MKITENFTLEELTASQTAARRGIDNTPPPELIENGKLLCEMVLEPLRAKLSRPIHITSGYRCAKLNKIIGGAKNSDHVKFLAADIWADSYDARELFDFIRKNFVGYKQCILEFPDSPQSWVHISYDKNNIKNQDLIAEKVNGRTVYSAVT